MSALVVRATATVPPDHSRPYFYGLHFLDLQGVHFNGVSEFVWELLQRRDT